jgi:hypothetical protein
MHDLCDFWKVLPDLLVFQPIERHYVPSSEITKNEKLCSENEKIAQSH